jgi:hypothetical protein
MRLPLVLLAPAALSVALCTSVRSENLVAQAGATLTPRAALAKQIQTIAFEFASNLENYSLVEKVEGLSWKLILMSEGLSSCALPAYDLPDRMESLNTQYFYSKQSLESLPANTPGSIRDESKSMMESSLDGTKKEVAKVLGNLIKYCK